MTQHSLIRQFFRFLGWVDRKDPMNYPWADMYPFPFAGVEPRRTYMTNIDRVEKKMLSGGGHVTADHTDLKDNGQQKGYVVLTPEERAKGFVRPVRTTYVHVGMRPKYPTKPLNADQDARYTHHNYVCYEPYPESMAPRMGRYWTQAELDSGCGASTIMARDIAETYARNPKFYGSTFCVKCAKHIRLDEFVWQGTDEVVGS